MLVEPELQSLLGEGRDHELKTSPYRRCMEESQGRLDPHDRAAVVRFLEEIRASLGSWCNLAFEELDDDHFDSSLFGFLAARGPANPLATVMRESGDKPLSVGIQHQAGTKAAQQLRDADLGLPEGARVRQDHPRRGLVVEWPENASSEELADWLVPAMRVLNRARTAETIWWTWSQPTSR